MSILSRVGKAAGHVANNLFGANGTAHSARIAVSYHDMAVDLETHYQALRLYKANNRLYHELAIALRQQGIHKEAMAGIRNPTNAATEFFPAVLWPGSLPKALPIQMRATDTRADNRRARIQHVWQWSNWGVNKQVFARNLPTLGDQYQKVVTKSDADGNVRAVFYRNIEPEHVTDFDTDERGFLTYVRIDVPRSRRRGDDIEYYTHIEVWDKATGLYRRWEHRREDDEKDLDQLGPPLQEDEIVDLTGDDFIPIVHTKFLDMGEQADGWKRGTALIVPALDKIDEINRMATRLHQLMFRHGSPDKQLVGSAVDADGLPMPPPKLNGNDSDMVAVGDETFYRVPGGWRVENIIANLPYAAHIEEIKASMDDLAETDLPELGYGRLVSSIASNISGRTIRMALTPAISRAVEARGNAETSLVRLDQMALSIAQNAGITGFSEGEIGTFGDGDFDHWFEERNVLPTDEYEDAQTLEASARGNALRQGYMHNRGLLKLDGLTDKQIDEIEAGQLGSAATLDESGQGPANLDRGFTG